MANLLLNNKLKRYFLANIDQKDVDSKLKATTLVYFFVVFIILYFIFFIVLSLALPETFDERIVMLQAVSPMCFGVICLWCIRSGKLEAVLNLSFLFAIFVGFFGFLTKNTRETAPFFASNIYYMLSVLGMMSLFNSRKHMLFIGMFFVVITPIYFWHISGFLDPFMYRMGELALIVGVFNLLLLFAVTYLHSSLREQFLGKTEEESRRTRDISIRINQLVEKRADDLHGEKEKFSKLNKEIQLADQSFNMVILKTDEYGRETQQIVNKMLDKTEEGKNIMVLVVSAVEAIESANQQLNNIIEIFRGIFSKAGVINEIVFETKILSFNAAIEAARAGEEGRGFAVVAEEVGYLAKKSGEAALEITNMLEESKNKVFQIIENIHKQSKSAQTISTTSLDKFGEIAQNIAILCDKIEHLRTSALEQENLVKKHFSKMKSI
ncbi:MAG: hypothetical protein HQK53_02485 [Oligoflexia bacterium]|nr:hypothetical protein [Oligoflexia bacterium]